MQEDMYQSWRYLSHNSDTILSKLYLDVTYKSVYLITLVQTLIKINKQYTTNKCCIRYRRIIFAFIDFTKLLTLGLVFIANGNFNHSVVLFTTKLLWHMVLWCTGIDGTFWFLVSYLWLIFSTAVRLRQQCSTNHFP